MKKILFVDDEPRLLEGLRRMLRSMRQEWQIDTANDGQTALEKLGVGVYDVVVSDMRMPGMDGIQLMNEVMNRYPRTVRIILSGQSDEESIIRCVGTTHQFLAKPCEADLLKSTIIRACALRDLVTDPDLEQLISQIDVLPTLPSLYVDPSHELAKQEPSVNKVGEIISRDMAVVAKILQLVNSAFFGLYHHITSPERAVAVLGLKTIEALVLSSKLYSQFDQTKLRSFNINTLMNHSLTAACYAKAIARDYGASQTIVDDSFSAGLLHDLGKLVLAANLPEYYTEAQSIAVRDDITPSESEKHIFGATHSSVGAYLLGLWGLPDSVVQAIAFHHDPDESEHDEFSALTAVHVADTFTYGISNETEGEPSHPICEKYLARIGVSNAIEGWRSMCEEIIDERAA